MSDNCLWLVCGQCPDAPLLLAKEYAGWHAWEGINPDSMSRPVDTALASLQPGVVISRRDVLKPLGPALTEWLNKHSGHGWRLELEETNQGDSIICPPA